MTATALKMPERTHCLTRWIILRYTGANSLGDFFFGHPAEKLPVGHGAFEKNWVETHSSNHECQEFLLHPEVCLPEWLGHIHPIGVEQDAQRGEELRRWIGRNIGSRSISV
jgi:hypothetical protein